jgi:AcrR family transcriptional regulator
LENVVTQAIALVDEAGLGGLTMSALANRLGVGTMTLYRYVESREALVDLMVGRLLTELPDRPALDAASWIDSLVDYMSALRAWAMERPTLIYLDKERPRLTGELARQVQRDLDELVRLGFTPREALTLRHALTVHLHGQVEFELTLRRAGSSPNELADLTGTLSEAIGQLETTDMAQLYAVGVRALLVGFAPLLAGR